MQGETGRKTNSIISIWNGGDFMISGKESLTGAILEALAMEKGTREFYAFASEKAKEPTARDMFVRLRDWEDDHMKYLEALYQALMNDRDLESYEQFSAHVPATHIEAGIPVKEAEEMFKRRQFANDKEAVDFALETEGKAFNLYRNLSESAEDRNAQVIFAEMKAQEQKHIDYLSEMKKTI